MVKIDVNIFKGKTRRVIKKLQIDTRVKNAEGKKGIKK